MSYALTEAEYAANEAGDTWVAALMGALGAALSGLQPLLTPGNYDTLVGLVLEDITSRAPSWTLLTTAVCTPLTGLA